MASADGIEGDTVSFDASRISKKEVLVVHIYSGGLLMCAPLVVLSDFSGTTDPENAVSTATATLNQFSNRPKPPQASAKGKATQNLLFAIALGMFALLPVSNMKVWQASAVPVQTVDEERIWCAIAERFYYWDRHTGASRWSWKSIDKRAGRVGDGGSAGRGARVGVEVVLGRRALHTRRHAKSANAYFCCRRGLHWMVAVPISRPSVQASYFVYQRPAPQDL